MNPFSPPNLGATLLTIVICATVLTVALLVLITAGDDRDIHRPRWAARYPAGSRRDIFGDVRRRLAALVIAAAVAMGPVSEEDWDAAARRAGWEPGDDEGQVRT